MKTSNHAVAATHILGEPVSSPLEKLRKFLETHGMNGKTGPRAFADFERDLHARMMEAERDVIAAEMVKLDVDHDAIEVGGKVHRRVLRRTQTYMTSAGEVAIERNLYKDRRDEEGHCVSPMEMSLGIVGGFWTPRAAEQALWVVTQMTPRKADELFERMGNMTPSKSSLDRLPKEVSEIWEENRARFEVALRDGMVLPEGTASIAISLDGVLAPVDGGNSPTKVRALAASEGRTSKGPAGYREVGCATLAFCDAKGDLLGAIRFARAPETKKATLKEMLSAEVRKVLATNSSLRLIKIADGATDNWDYLTSAALPPSDEALDFFHASEHLHAAVATAYGDGTRETRFRYESLRDVLRDEEGGVEKVIRALKHLAARHPKSATLKTELAYFRKHRRRMRYAELAAAGLMIGSGIVEASCRTLVAQRLKQSGMRWSIAGAQAILTPRGWDQSDRFDQAWALVAATFHTGVTVLANVVAIRPGSKSEARARAASR